MNRGGAHAIAAPDICRHFFYETPPHIQHSRLTGQGLSLTFTFTVTPSRNYSTLICSYQSQQTTDCVTDSRYDDLSSLSDR
ncbi:hypothetical protein BDR04DRAFT_359181 [Suillus decipiens]|nr:hypothetical protein BDR04DRAFT_359181 [Suillus decipiens]